MAPRAAMLESVRTRIRPIFMTTFIALFGLLPLVISPGAGSELYRGQTSTSKHNSPLTRDRITLKTGMDTRGEYLDGY
jgi:hypothetical protein